MDKPARFPLALRLATAGCLLLASVVALLTATIAWQCQWSGPFRDLWEVMPLIERSFTGNWHWQDFWAPYGGAHRLVIPRLLFVAEYHLTGGSNYLVLCVSLSCLLLTLGLLVGRVRQCHPGAHTLHALAAAMACITLFSPTQLFNLNYSYDTQWFQAVCFSTLALFLASDARLPQRPVLYGSAALLAGLAASLSNMAGFLAWPSLLLLLWHNNPSRTQRYACATAILIAITVHAYGIGGTGTDQDGNDASLLASLPGVVLHLLRYTALYLGSPLTRHWPLAAGLLALAAAAWLLADGLRARQPDAVARPLRQLLGGLALQAILVAMATAWGRRYYPLDMAMAERYQAIALLFWLLAGLALLSWLQRRSQHWLPLLAFGSFAAALALPQANSTRSAIYLSNAVQQGHLGAALGLTELQVAANTLSFPAIQLRRNHVAQHNDFLRRHALAYFRDPLPAMPGQQLDSRTILSRDDCQFMLASRSPLAEAEAHQISGHWQCAVAARQIVLTDADYRVVGLLNAPPAAWLLQAAWNGYALGTAGTLVPVAISADGTRLAGQALELP